ncbi:MAG TPA: hypothetical protein VFL27_11215 [Candidatus Dormibacteraeota bacterium]|nr:hypothetical protein [Candidatus Dormibacteraeota bacterium]
MSAVARGRRVEYRPRVADNVPGMAIFTALGVFFIALFAFTRAWTSGAWTIGATALLVGAFAGLPWAYLLTARLWIDGDEVGTDRLLFLKARAPRGEIRHVVAGQSKVVFVGHGDRVLLAVRRFFSDDQIRSIAADLGLKAEGYARYMGGPL